MVKEAVISEVIINKSATSMYNQYKKFDNTFHLSFPILQVEGACFSKVRPTPVENPSLICASLSALNLLDISPDQSKRPEFVEYFR